MSQLELPFVSTEALEARIAALEHKLQIIETCLVIHDHDEDGTAIIWDDENSRYLPLSADDPLTGEAAPI